jgi:ABC-2 type transport system permease protein
VADLRYTLRIWSRLVGVQVRSQMNYRASFLFDFFGMGFNTLLEFAAFALALPMFGDLGGWGVGEIAFLYGTVNLAFGLMDLVFSGFDPGYFGQQIRLGRLDQMLLRPVNITFQVFGSEFVLRRFGRILVGLAILLLSFSMLDISWSADKVILLLLTVFGQVVFFGGLFIIGATITFWTVESIEVMNIFTYGGATLIYYPMHIYPNWLRKFFTYILPGIFLNYYPALYILERSDPFGMQVFTPWMAPLAGLVVLAVAFKFWQFGLRHYQSTGT